MSARWGGVEAAQSDPITSLAAALKADTHPQKVGLCQGAYKDEDGNPFLLRAVAQAEAAIAAEPAEHEYPVRPQNPAGAAGWPSWALTDRCWQGVDGVPAFVELARDFVFGPDSPPVLEGRVSSVQTLSGSGALRVCAEALMHVSDSADKSVWLSDPSWSVHHLLLLKGTGQAGCSCTQGQPRAHIRVGRAGGPPLPLPGLPRHGPRLRGHARRPGDGRAPRQRRPAVSRATAPTFWLGDGCATAA